MAANLSSIILRQNGSHSVIRLIDDHTFHTIWQKKFQSQTTTASLFLTWLTPDHNWQNHSPKDNICQIIIWDAVGGKPQLTKQNIFVGNLFYLMREKKKIPYLNGFLEATLPLERLEPDGMPATLEVDGHELQRVLLFVVVTGPCVRLETLTQLQNSRDDLWVRFDLKL